MPRQFSVLRPEEVKARFPAIYADRPASHVSQDYQFVNTGLLVDSLLAKGWEIIQASQQNVRQADKMEGTKHSVSLRPGTNNSYCPHLGVLFPSIFIVNSHDWSSRLIIEFGFWRQVCGNGAIGFSAQGGFNVRHDTFAEDLEGVLNRFASYGSHLMLMAERWNAIRLLGDQVRELAIGAAKIRFGEEATEDHARSLVIPRRSFDDKDDLWSVFNTIQENATQGGVKTGSLKRRIRALTNIQANRDVNVELFELARKFDTI